MTLFVPQATGLVSAVRGAAQAAFSALESFQISFQIIRFMNSESSDYDPETGMLVSRIEVLEDSKGVFVDYNLDDIDEKVILRADQQLLILRSTVVGNDITTEDKIRVGAATLDIVNVSVDPAGALYTLQVRQVSK